MTPNYNDIKKAQRMALDRDWKTGSLVRMRLNGKRRVVEFGGTTLEGKWKFYIGGDNYKTIEIPPQPKQA